MEEIFPLLSQLSFEELSNLCATSSQYQKICENDQVWETFYLRDFGPITDRPVVSWKFEYLVRKGNSKMALIDSDRKIQKPNVQFSKISQVAYIGSRLFVLEASGQLYFSGLSENEGVWSPSFSKVKGSLFSQISERYNFGVTTEGVILTLNFIAEGSLIITQEIPGFFPGVISDTFDGFNGNFYAQTRDTRELYHIPLREFPHGISKIPISPVGYVWPLDDENVIITRGPNFEPYLYSGYRYGHGLRPLVVDGPPVRGIKDVKRDKLLLEDGRFFGYFVGVFINWKDQWADFDPEWQNRQIQKISEDFLLLTDGTVWDISLKFPQMPDYLQRIQFQSSSAEIEDFKRQFLPEPRNFPEPIVQISREGFLGEKGTFFIKKQDSLITVQSSEYGFRANRFLEVGLYQKYVLWRNFELTISRSLFQLLLEKEVISSWPEASMFYYQGQPIQVTKN